jgi:hypothetical protein
MELAMGDDLQIAHAPDGLIASARRRFRHQTTL